MVKFYCISFFFFLNQSKMRSRKKKLFYFQFVTLQMLQKNGEEELK